MSLRTPQKLKIDNSTYIKELTTSNINKKVELLNKLDYPIPNQWGVEVTGVKTHLQTEEKVIALTFDACGSPTGNGYDQKLINYLNEQNIPATLFINRRWIENNQLTFQQLADNKLFQIENHGNKHKPLSVNGKQAYGIDGTNSVNEVIEEVLSNYEMIYQLTGHKSSYFRSGTAHYDEIAISILNRLGIEVVNFDINGDAGATLSANQVKKSLMQAKAGSIVIFHMNQPSSETAEGIKMAVPKLREKGFNFVNLADYDLK